MPSPAARALAALFVTLAAPLLAQSAVNFTLTAAEGTANLGPGYTSETAWTYNGTLPGPTIRVTEGQLLRVRFQNHLSEDSIVHFHGQPLPGGMDGMSGISRPVVAPGQEFLYELPNLHTGTYWFHPHSANHHNQLDSGLHGVLIVDPANPANDPAFDIEQTIVLDDWLQPFGGAFNGHLLNGKSSAGQSAIVVQPGQKLRLRFINAAAMTHYVVALDGHPLTVTHADGQRVLPVVVGALPIGIGERYDVIVDCNSPGIWSLAVGLLQNRSAMLVRGVVQYAGQTGPWPSATYVPANLASGTLLDYSMLASYWPVAPITPTPNQTFPAVLGQQMSGMNMLFTINGAAYPNITPWVVNQNDIVQIDLANTTYQGQSMYHPMHLHGHSFRLMGTTAGGTVNPPLKDTVLIRRVGQPGANMSIQFTADNPGRWLFHCHDMMHMMNGMVTLLDYSGDADGDGIPNVADLDPRTAAPVLTVPENPAAFAPGGVGALSAQWQPGQSVAFLVSMFEANPPVPLPPYGTLYLSSLTWLATAPVAGNGVASFPYILPADPNLSGFRIAMQAMGSTSLPGGVRLSPFQAFNVR